MGKKGYLFDPDGAIGKAVDAGSEFDYVTPLAAQTDIPAGCWLLLGMLLIVALVALVSGGFVYEGMF
jgi:hypothetical protein